MASVRGVTGGDDDLVGETVTDLFTEPEEMADIVGADCWGEFDFECDDLAIASFDDQVDFAGVFSIGGTQMSDISMHRLGIDAYALGDKGLEKRAQPRSCRGHNTMSISVEKACLAHSD